MAAIIPCAMTSLNTDCLARREAPEDEVGKASRLLCDMELVH